jgi:trypsin
MNTRLASPRLVVGMSARGLAICLLATCALALPAASAAADGLPSGKVRVGPDRYLVDAAKIDARGDLAPARSRSSATPRIVGGNPAAISQWPWQVGVTFSPDLFSGSPYHRLTCGATLVAPTVAVTAAHCLFDDDAGFLSPELFATVTGRTQLSAPGGLELPIDTYYYFQNGAGVQLYNPSTAAWDVAVLKLGAPAAGSPIKLAGADERAVWEAGRDAYVTGWGATAEDGAVSDTLRAARVLMIGDPGCASAYPGSFQPLVMTCAGLAGGGADSCQGDSGGPLVAPIAGGGYRLVGDTSFGEGCGRPGLPGVYGRLADDPIRGALRQAALDIAGIDIVGSGAQPSQSPVPPPAPPTPPAGCVTAQAAVDAAQSKLARAKQALRRADGRGERKRAKKKLGRAKGDLRSAKSTLAACRLSAE